jgi:3-carboxy-cis,cis-muconate cycloisomerase
MAGALAARTLARALLRTAFAAPAFVRAMLAFESALARAAGRRGLIPPPARGHHRRLRVGSSRRGAWSPRQALRHARGPLVEMLRAEVARRRDAAQHVHFGATSQDVLDTAMALCLQGMPRGSRPQPRGRVRGARREAREHAPRR